MHIFDVCSPSSGSSPKPLVISEAAKGSVTSTKELPLDARDATNEIGVAVFLDALSTAEGASDQKPRVTNYTFDPSMYHFDRSLRSATKASKSATSAFDRKAENNQVHLPLRGQTLELPKSDVIMVRFRKRQEAGVAAARTIFREEEAESSSTIEEVLEGQWSPQMAKTLRTATKIALDLTEPWIAELGSELAYEEITFLACTLQHDLEVLYLVDNCVGRCTSCGNAELRAKDLQARKHLWKCLNYQDKFAAQRQGDVIEAVSKRYTEVADLERLGWSDTHPYFIFARMIDELIRGQQHGENRGKFQGVRILIAEDEPLNGGVSDMKVHCGGRKAKDSALDLAMGLMPAFAGVWND